MVLKQIDLFLLKEYVPPLIFLLVVVVGVWVGSSTLQYIFAMMADFGIPFYYSWILLILRIPSIIASALPATILLCTVVVLGLNRQGELTYLRSAGISVFRIIAAPLVLACSLTLLSYALSEFVAPVAAVASKRIIFLGMYKGVSPYGINCSMAPHFRDGEIEKVMYFGRPDSGAFASIVVLDFQKKGATGVTCAPSAKWWHGCWVLKNGTTHELSNNTFDHRKLKFQRLVIPGTRDDVDVSAMVSALPPREMGIVELQQHLRSSMPEHERTKSLVRLYDKFFAPLSCICMLLAGSIVMFRKRRDPILQTLFPASILIAYYFLRAAMMGLAENGRIEPMIATAIPTIVTGTFSILVLLILSGELRFVLPELPVWGRQVDHELSS